MKSSAIDMKDGGMFLKGKAFVNVGKNSILDDYLKLKE